MGAPRSGPGHDDDPVTGRRTLTGSAYADDRHIRSRMAIYAYAETAADPRWRTSVIPWDGTQNSSAHLAEINELLYAAVSSQLDRPVRAMPADSFTTQTGTAVLSREFTNVTLRTLYVSLSIPTAQPVITYVASIREPILAGIGEPPDFDAVLDDIAVKVEQVIQAQGSFRATTHMGVFICR